jgi:hypothetical protein
LYDEPAIAVGAAGNAALAWYYRYTDRNTVVTAYRPAGGAWSGFFAEPSAYAPDVAMDSLGHAHLAFVSERNPNRIPHVYGATIRPGGGGWTAGQVSDGRFDQALGTPAIAVSAAGKQVAVWSGQGDIFAASREPGAAWSESQPVVDESCSTPADPPDLAVDAAGNSYAVWQDEHSGRSEIYFAYRPASGSWGTPVQLGDPGADDCRSPAIAVDAQGNAAVVWSQWHDRAYGVYAATRSPGGSWSALWLDSRTGSWRLAFSTARHVDVAMSLRRFLALIRRN